MIRQILITLICIFTPEMRFYYKRPPASGGFSQDHYRGLRPWASQ